MCVNIAIGVLVEKRRGQWQVLITRRRKDTVLGGFWELPGGKVEPGESIAHCLVREYDEELGIAIRVDQALPIIEHRYDHGHIRLHPHFCTRRSGEPQDLAVAEHRWVTGPELSSYRFPPANDELMVQIAQDLERRS